jgi:hypothetical protein
MAAVSRGTWARRMKGGLFDMVGVNCVVIFCIFYICIMNKYKALSCANCQDARTECF